LLLARLFARPANVLVLDEPTNDLDIETLDLLEDLLQSYEGTVFLVSHDRTFLDNVVTSTIVYEGDAHWREYEGGIQDWLLQSQRSRDLIAQPATAATPEKTDRNGTSGNTGERQQLSKKKLSYKEQRELEQLPSLISSLEEEQSSIRNELADGTIYTRDATRATTLHTRENAIEEALMTALERWTALTES